jgi:hypothetical protein
MDRASRLTRRIGPWAGARKRRHTSRLREWTPLVVALALLLGSPLLTWAHSDRPSSLSFDQPLHHECQKPHPWFSVAQPTSPAIPGVPLPFMLFVLMAVAMAQDVWRWRRTIALSLVLVLSTFTLGVAVHSVHHLSEPEKAAECLVFSASQHVSGTLADSCDIYAPLLAVTTASPGNSDVPTFIRRFRSDLPRAPPLFLS